MYYKANNSHFHSMDNMEPLKFFEHWSEVLKVVFQECRVVRRLGKQDAGNYCSSLKFSNFTK